MRKQQQTEQDPSVADSAARRPASRRRNRSDSPALVPSKRRFLRKRRKKELTPQQEIRRKSRGLTLRAWLFRLLFAVVLVTVAVLALTVFFRVDNIYLEGETRYTLSALEEGLGIEQGHNLYLWNKIKAEDELLEQFPYLDSVQIRRKLPDSLVITVHECDAVLAVPCDSGYYLLSKTGKVLEMADSPGSLPLATGLTLMGETAGKTIRRNADAYADALIQVLDALEGADMADKLNFINLQSLTDIRIGYDGRFDLRVGTIDDMNYRLLFAQTVIQERLSPSDIGRLYWDGRDRLHFVPESAEEVAYSATSLEAYVAPAQPAGDKTDGADENTDAAQEDNEYTDESTDNSGDDSYEDTTYEDTTYEDTTYEDTGEYDDMQYDEEGG